MTIDTIFICFCEDCERNDGLSRPYYMSRGLMDFVQGSKNLLEIRDCRANQGTWSPRNVPPKSHHHLPANFAAQSRPINCDLLPLSITIQFAPVKCMQNDPNRNRRHTKCAVIKIQLVISRVSYQFDMPQYTILMNVQCTYLQEIGFFNWKIGILECTYD